MWICILLNSPLSASQIKGHTVPLLDVAPSHPQHRMCPFMLLHNHVIINRLNLKQALRERRPNHPQKPLTAMTEMTFLYVSPLHHHHNNLIAKLSCLLHFLLFTCMPKRSSDSQEAWKIHPNKRWPRKKTKNKKKQRSGSIVLLSHTKHAKLNRCTPLDRVMFHVCAFAFKKCVGICVKCWNVARRDVCWVMMPGFQAACLPRDSLYV